MSELVTRALTGTAYVAITIGAACAGPWTSLVVFMPVCAIAASEWHRLYWSDEAKSPNAAIAPALAMLTFLSIAPVGLITDWSWVQAMAVIFIALVALCFHLMQRGSTDPGREIGHYSGVVIYIAVPFALITHLLLIGPHVFIGFMFLLWTSDTGAYLVGRAIGRTKLMPKVSPGKTWEGLIGGIVLTMFIGWLLARNWQDLRMEQWLVSAAVVAIAATLGDLLESALKRARGVKDSGRVLPGHGGILDRFDGFLLAAPAMLLTLLLLG